MVPQRKNALVVILACIVLISGVMFSYVVPAIGKVTITHMQLDTSPVAVKLFKEIIGQFESEYPNIEVKLIAPPFREQYGKLLVMISAGNPPDTVQVQERRVASLAKMGAIINLESRIADWEGKEEMIPLWFDLARSYQNTAYGLPYWRCQRCLYYRKDWFDESGLESPETIYDYYTVAEKLTDPGKGRYGTFMRGGFGYWDTSVDYWMRNWAGLKDYFDEDDNCLLDHPRAIAGLAMLASMYRNGWAPPESVTWGYEEMVGAFYSNVVAMIIQDTEVIGTCKRRMDEGTWMTAKVPIGAGNKCYLPIGYMPNAILRESEHKEEGWKFITFMLRPEINLKWAKGTWALPVTKKAIEDPYFAKDKYFEVYPKMDRDPRYVLHIAQPFYLPEWVDFTEKEGSDMFQKILLGKMTPAEVAYKWTEFLEAAQKRWSAAE